VKPQSPIINFSYWRCGPTRAIASSVLRFLDHTQRLTTFGRTPLDEWSACRRVLYLTTHNTHKRQTSMPPAGFEPIIRAGERPHVRLRRCCHWDRQYFKGALKLKENHFPVQHKVNFWFVLLFVSDKSEKYIRVSFVFDKRLCGQKSPQFFVGHVRYICPILTETETAW